MEFLLRKPEAIQRAMSFMIHDHTVAIVRLRRKEGVPYTVAEEAEEHLEEEASDDSGTDAEDADDTSSLLYDSATMPTGGTPRRFLLTGLNEHALFSEVKLSLVRYGRVVAFDGCAVDHNGTWTRARGDAEPVGTGTDRLTMHRLKSSATRDDPRALVQQHEMTFVERRADIMGNDFEIFVRGDSVRVQALDGRDSTASVGVVHEDPPLYVPAGPSGGSRDRDGGTSQ